ncbi:hypothetical protein GBA52_000103 [Prunus armeniaca]|nr:hypothetical protein GBA52_000103 [Prunus armeniaca]
MSLAFRLSCFTSPPNLTHQRISVRPKTPSHFPPPKLTTLPTIRAVQENSEHSTVSPAKPRWGKNTVHCSKLVPFLCDCWGCCCLPQTLCFFMVC